MATKYQARPVVDSGRLSNAPQSAENIVVVLDAAAVVVVVVVTCCEGSTATCQAAAAEFIAKGNAAIHRHSLNRSADSQRLTSWTDRYGRSQVVASRRRGRLRCAAVAPSTSRRVASRLSILAKPRIHFTVRRIVEIEIK